MQAESSKNNPTFPSLEYFLPDNEYDSDDFDFLEYDLVEKLDEINTEQNEEIINEKMRKDNNAMVNNNEDNIIIENEDDVIVEDNVMVEDVKDNVININLQKKKRKRSKKIILQTDIDKLQNKLHANKYFMEKITPELVHCKCGKEICLDQKFRDKNLTTHGELSNCKYSNEGQQSIKVFFKTKKIRVEEENIIIKKVACKGLYKDKYQEYVLNSPAKFGGSIRSDIAIKELFPEIVKANLRLKSLGKTRCADLKNYLHAHAIWILDKTTLSIRSKTCENFTTRESGICDECDKLRKNSRLNQATKKVSANNSDNDAEIWFKLAQFEKDGLFKGEKTFQELAALMVQIQEKKLQDKKMTGLRYTEYLKQFFCLLSESSCKYEIFRQMFAGMSIRSIKYSEQKKNRPIVGMTDCTKIQPKLTYSDELGCIISMEKIPPFVIAMLPTNGESNAMEIYNLLMNVLIMLRDMPIYQNLSIMTVQDVKHAKKTARNQLHLGARLLILGNNVILYRHLLTLAQAKNHAIYIQDVVNIDKQDDGATYRLFHSDVLE
ncbi:hypothetical protein GLOIN_2v1777971 [Rhizophagus clarus]|uniref:Uncharacterized protein n=1 Tax=Rhizophagus clarus TaxID=94130 RepID=A0A8H3R1I8_9GLOM|nr:hypothetical protein GLOIN_2v1777971 [Rhizophagus clarus]